MASAPVFDEHPFSVSLKDGLAFLSWQDGHNRVTSLRVLRIEHARVTKAIADYDAASAEVVRLRRKPPG